MVKRKNDNTQINKAEILGKISDSRPERKIHGNSVGTLKYLSTLCSQSQEQQIIVHLRVVHVQCQVNINFRTDVMNFVFDGEFVTAA